MGLNRKVSRDVSGPAKRLNKPSNNSQSTLSKFFGPAKKEAVEHLENSGDSSVLQKKEVIDNIQNETEAERKSAEVHDDHSDSTEPKASDIMGKSEDSYDEPPSKKVKIEENVPEVNNWLTVPQKCHICRQLISSPDLSLYGGHPKDAVEEFVALIDPRLSLFSGEEGFINDEDQRPQNKLTEFSVYDKEGHLCPLDADLIERNVLLYMSGYMKAIYEENPDVDGGIPCKDIGPINEWFVSGFDGGEKALLGISTAYGDYFLMNPSQSYAPFIDSINNKIYLSKLVIEFLLDEPEASYEDLLNKLETSVPPVNIDMSEDNLLRHAQFICDQVQSFDSACEGDLLVTQPCMRSFIRLAGVTLGKRRSIRKVERKIKGEKRPSWTKAASTDLVKKVFDSFFTEQIAGNDQKDKQGPRRQRCGICEVCQLADCGKCNSCKDMVKFGGSGRSKQACLLRRCPNMAVQEAEESELEEGNDQDGYDEEDYEDNELEPESGKQNKSARVVVGALKSREVVEWIGEPLATDENGSFYRRVRVNDLEFGIDDCVMVKPASHIGQLLIGKVVTLVKEEGEEPLFHAQWFIRGTDTVLGETSDRRELFLQDCGFAYISAVKHVVKVVFKAPSPEWHVLGGEPEPTALLDDEKTFFYQKCYDERTGRIEDPVFPSCSVKAKEHSFCGNCERKLINYSNFKLEVVPFKDEERNSEVLDFSAVRWKGEEFHPGHGVYLSADTFSFKNFVVELKRESCAKVVDDVLYPEAYRKSSDRIKGSNEKTPEPYSIGVVRSIFSKTSKSKSQLKSSDVLLRVTKMYRPENTHRGAEAAHQLDLNVLYWSEEEIVISLQKVKGKCYVVYGDNLNMPESEWTVGGPDRFYFREMYHVKSKTFDDPPPSAMSLGLQGKGKGKGKGKSCKASISSSEKSALEIPAFPSVSRKLKTLDVFAGCGGLSKGLHQAGISEVVWAIEKEDAAARAFRLNNPSATVFTEDCNVLLQQAMEGNRTWKGQNLPQKGQVELLCGGPPCQGFSGMNRFNSRQYSLFKNSLIVSYLAYCDYYRPRFFILENVRNFVAYKKGIILKLTLRCLVQMGYQCTFGVLQAGNHGVPQTRRRAFILAAAPGEILPEFPAPLHVFSPQAGQLTIQLDGKKYKASGHHHGAPYRTITVRDAMSDLPEIVNGCCKEEMAYGIEPLSDFQRKIRGKDYQSVLRDHICKLMNPLVEARMANIPVVPGSDWRDLPNIDVRLSNGEVAKKLIYSHHDIKQGRSPSGALRGVCSCAEGKPCDPMDHQKNTLIPWCLSHTANRHNHWAGLYGRLEWDGFFSTTVTNPEPMGKQGRVLHPEQTRVVSVRECARSQGFPDSFRFYGKIVEKHRQVGNAVPPPMGRAIGLQILKSCSMKDTVLDSKSS